MPFGGFFLKLIGGQILSSVFQKIASGQVNTTVDTPIGPEVDTKHWVFSKTIWGGIGVLGYVVFDIFTGHQISIDDVNSIISAGGNVFLTAAAILTIYGRSTV